MGARRGPFKICASWFKADLELLSFGSLKERMSQHNARAEWH